jgi:hypothetical protein
MGLGSSFEMAGLHSKVKPQYHYPYMESHLGGTVDIPSGDSCRVYGFAGRSRDLGMDDFDERKPK